MKKSNLILLIITLISLVIFMSFTVLTVMSLPKLDIFYVSMAGGFMGITFFLAMVGMYRHKNDTDITIELL